MTSRRRGITDGNQPCSMLTGSSPEKFSPPSQVVPIHGSLSSMHAHERRQRWWRYCRGIDGTRMRQPWNPKACTPGALRKGQPEGLPSTPQIHLVPRRRVISHHRGASVTSITRRLKPTREFWRRLMVQLMQDSGRSMKGDGRTGGRGEFNQT